MPGYLEEEGVPPDSTTETFAALRVEVDSWRWAGVPFYLRTGKRLARKLTEIAVTLKPVPHLGFSQDGSIGVRPNQLVLTIQPNEGVSLSLAAKIPGTRMRIRPVNMEFLYGTTFLSQSPEAYERLILDVMRGDATLFTRNDEVEEQWRICDPIVQAWEKMPGPLPQYPAGSRDRPTPTRSCCRAIPGGGSEARAWPASDTSRGRAQGTTPAEIEAALRKLLVEGQMRYAGHAPARALNMVCVVDKQSSERSPNACAAQAAISRRGRSCARSSPAAPRSTRPRHQLRRDRGRAGPRADSRDRDPRARRAAPPAPRADRRSAGSDRPSHGVVGPTRHEEAVRALLPLSQVMLLDSVDHPDLARRWATPARSQSAYVVDLAWLRSTPWRERVAATFDPPDLRPDLHAISAVTVRHHPESAAAGLLLVGWLASRLNWKLNKLAPRNGDLAGAARVGRQDIQVSLEPVPQECAASRG